MSKQHDGLKIPKWVRDYFDKNPVVAFHEWAGESDTAWVVDLPGYQRVDDFADISPNFDEAWEEDDQIVVPGTVTVELEDAKGDEDGIGGCGSLETTFEARFDKAERTVSVDVLPADEYLEGPEWQGPDASRPLAAYPRQVVAAFLDVRGFTTWFNEMPNRNRNVPIFMQKFWQLIEDSTPEEPFNIRRKPMGDGCMFLWLPDESDGALAAALQQAIASLLRAVSGWEAMTAGLDFKAPKGIGMAVATGEALFLKQSPEGSAGENYFDVVGSPLNLASRICSHAKAGQVLVEADVPLQLRKPKGFTFGNWSPEPNAMAKGYSQEVLKGVRLVNPARVGN